MLLVATVLLLDHHPREPVHYRCEHPEGVTHRPATRHNRVDLVDLGDLEVVKLLLVGVRHVLAFIDKATCILTNLGSGVLDGVVNGDPPQVRGTLLGLELGHSQLAEQLEVELLLANLLVVLDELESHGLPGGCEGGFCCRLVCLELPVLLLDTRS